MYFLKDLGALERLVQKEIENHDTPEGGGGGGGDEQRAPDDDQGEHPEE
jgi:hypothetical protein